MKKIIILILLSVCLSSCNNDKDIFASVKADFSQFDSSNDVALVVENSIVCFQDYEVDLNELIKDDSNLYRTIEVVLRNDKIYFAVSRQMNGNWSFSLYHCDLMGNDLNMIFEKKNIDTEASAHSSDSLLYIEYKLNGVSFVDSYNCSTEEYVTLGSGADVKYENFLNGSRTYSVEKLKDHFAISNNQTKDTYVIDDEYLKGTEYFEIMKKYDFKPSHYSLTEDKVTLIYRVDAPFSLTAHYTMLLFEYEVASNNLAFLSVLNPYDTEGVEVRYNSKM